MKHVFFIVLSFITISCGGKGGGGESESVVPNRSVFSVWAVKDGQAGTVFDFSSHNFDTPGSMSLELLNGAVCNADVVFNDEDDEGDQYNYFSITFSNASWDNTTGGSDPGCAAIFNGYWWGIVDGNELELCPPYGDQCLVRYPPQ
jgi:hypothetical protein